MDEAIDSTFELLRLSSRWFAVGCGASSSAPEATRSHFTRSEATSERSRGHSKPQESSLELLEAAGRPPRASRSRRESSPRDPQAREYSRKLDKTEVGGTSAAGASGASRWLLPEPLEPRDGCPQSLWSLEINAASRKMSRRRSKKLRSSSKMPSSKALSD